MIVGAAGAGSAAPAKRGRPAMLAVALLVLATPARAQTAALAGLDAYIEQARRDWDVPGVAVVVVKGDEIVYAKGFGARESGKPGAVDPDTVFAIGSATKAFTGAALGMLVDDGKIGWDGVVHDYMPAFRLHDPYATHRATVRDLLSHRTGFAGGYGWLWTGSGFNRGEIVRRLRFQADGPGFRDRFQYANETYTAAGEIIPAVTGTSWDDFLATRLFRPLGMTRTGTTVAGLGELGNVARPHGVVDGRLVSFPYRNVDNVGGAGAINSTARDMAQWVRLQLNGGVHGGRRLIAAATLADTHAGQAIPRGGLGSATADAKFVQYGFGWIVHDYRGRKVVQHAGGVDGMLSVVGMMPDEGIGVVVLTNRLPHQLTHAIEYKMFDALLGGDGADWSAVLKARDDRAKAERDRAGAVRAGAARAPAATPLLPLDRYVGSYVSDLYGRVDVRLDRGSLLLSRPTAAARLRPEGGNRFGGRWTSDGIHSVYGETPVGFTIGADGRVDSLDLGPDRFRRGSGAK